MAAISFEVNQQDSNSEARLGTLQTAHGTIQTPAFMPVGTRASVKTMTNRQLEEIDASIILGNTYHLMLRPGMEVIEAAGGLHAFMGWERPILTDSGGFQVFSLADNNKITQEGVEFRSHIDGSRHFLGPEESMSIQRTLGSDIVMAFDQCPPYPCARSDVEAAVERTKIWAERCRSFQLQPHQNLFGIIQGGVHEDLRKRSAEALVAMEFEGYAIGGLSVGEPMDVMYEVLNGCVHCLPEGKPRYLMGVGTPRNLVEAVLRGVDMFDCVMPTRNARNGTIFTWEGKLSIKAGRYAKDFSPIDPHLDCYASKFSKAYLRHLLNVDEITGLTLATMQNLAFYLDFMRHLRRAIKKGSLQEFYQKVVSLYPQ